MNTLYRDAVVAALIFTTTFFASLILYDFFRSFINQFIHTWEVNQYLKAQSNLEKALLIAKHNQELYDELYRIIITENQTVDKEDEES
jgi:hypothetical protein